MLWIIGVLIFLVMMATAFMGYSLPWGQMSFWAVTVITNLFSSLDQHRHGPRHHDRAVAVGRLLGSGATLNRFYSLHYLLPFVIAGLVGLHLWALHVVGQNSPTGARRQDRRRDAVPMHPVCDVEGCGSACSPSSSCSPGSCSSCRTTSATPTTTSPANPLVTPPHIVPEWYFLPYYAILRAIPRSSTSSRRHRDVLLDRVLLFVPWLDTARVRSTKYRPIYKWFFWLLVITCVALGYLGSKPPEGGLRDLGADFHRLLLRAFPDGHADRRHDRDAEARLPRSIANSIFGGSSHGGGRMPQPAPASAEKR